MKNPLPVSLRLLFPLLIGGTTAHAATLSGIVMEEEEAVADAEIVLINAESRIILKKTLSGADGSFSFSVTPGSFNIEASKPDYTDGWSRGVVVSDSDVAVQIKVMNKAFAEENTATKGSDDCD